MDFRTSGIIAGAAFILSFLIGLVSRTSMPMAIIRPLIFGLLFFIIPSLVSLLVNRFLPELLENNDPGENAGLSSGSRINITLGDSMDPDRDSTSDLSQNVLNPAIPGAVADESDEGLGDIADLLRRGASQPERPAALTGMDQNAEEGYTKTEGFDDFTSSKPAGTSAGIPVGVAEENPNSAEMLPDLDSMAGAFVPIAADEEPDTTEYSVSTPSKKPSSGDKASAWTGDFNAKDIAMGLRTVLNKEKKEKEG